MAQFDESKVINALHPEKAEVRKKYWFADSISFLKASVKSNLASNVYELRTVKNGYYPFQAEDEDNYTQFLYPYEEPPKQRMTNIQLMEWISKRNGMFKYENGNSYCYTHCAYSEKELNDEVGKDMVIRSWGSEEWIEPTVDIYERDCKGGEE